MYIKLNKDGLLELHRKGTCFPGTEQEVKSFCLAIGMPDKEFEIAMFDLEPGVELHFGDVHMTYMYPSKKVA